VRIAVIGSGVSGLSAAYGLNTQHDVTVFEADERVGGHVNTVPVKTAEGVVGVDTGFIVFNRRTYPLFSALLDRLGVATQPSEMSFSVSSEHASYEFRGDGLGPWVQRSVILDPRHTRMLVDILRFNWLARGVARRNEAGTLGEFLSVYRFGQRFVQRFLMPLGSAIWSADPASFDEIPMLTFSRFMDNHGMLSLTRRPHWFTIVGGSARYVEALTASFAHRIRRRCRVDKVTREVGSVSVLSEAGLEVFDGVVFAVHSSDALRLLGDPTRKESELLGRIRYLSSRATLHTDVRMMPRRRRAWAAWNAHLPPVGYPGPTVTYWMNRLQRLAVSDPILVTLNRELEIDPDLVLGQWDYAHPVFDQGAIAAQSQRDLIQGVRNTWYCGAYWGYGFHEDGVRSARDVCTALGVPWITPS
jgi:uncharacterized protein